MTVHMFSTVSPSEGRQAAAELRRRGFEVLDSPRLASYVVQVTSDRADAVEAVLQVAPGLHYVHGSDG